MSELILVDVAELDARRAAAQLGFHACA